MVGYSRAEFSVQPVLTDETVDASVFESYERRSLVPNRLQTICVVDDDASVLKALGRLLSSAGLGMTGFNDPRLFLEHVKEQHGCAGDSRCLDAGAERFGSSAITSDHRAVYASHYHDCKRRSRNGSHRVYPRRYRFLYQAV